MKIKWKRGVELEEIETKISWCTLHQEILFEDCLAWRGNQESRDGLALLRAILLHRKTHLKCPSSPSIFLSHLFLIKCCLP